MKHHRASPPCFPFLMFFFLISFFPFALLLSKSLLPWAGELRLLSALLWQQLLSPLRHLLDKCRPIATRKFAASPSTMVSSRNCCARREENRQESGEPSVLDLPELALECILGKLSPAGLANMAAVCSSLRERCRGDHLWEKHMRKKWGRVVGHAAGRQWKLYMASAAAKSSSAGFASSKNWIGSLSCAWPITWPRDRADGAGEGKNLPPDCSLMSWYQSLESGKLWFPAQIYNREHGHLGFVLSCYDAEVSYNCRTDTFNARYPPHGERTVVIEEGVEWNRLRAPPVDTSAHELHISDCLNDLRPGDYIEIQWRRNKEFPYGWWYGVIGHLESCDGNERFCRCHSSNAIVLEFSQYTPGSRWRQTLINRKDHREEGNEEDGFYGGLRKLQSKEEMSKWRELWPTDVLE